MGFRVDSPAPQTGYNRTTDWPATGGGTGKGGSGMGSFLSAKIGTSGDGSQWHPTVLWMMGFVVLELAAFHLLSKYMRI